MDDSESFILMGKVHLAILKQLRSHFCPQTIIMAAILDNCSRLEAFYQNHKLFPSG